jgi:hypothetical protein
MGSVPKTAFNQPLSKLLLIVDSDRAADSMLPEWFPAIIEWYSISQALKRVNDMFEHACSEHLQVGIEEESLGSNVAR